MAIIVILSGLVILLGPAAISKQKRARAAAEIVALKGACEWYKTDNGGYPRELSTSGWIGNYPKSTTPIYGHGSPWTAINGC